LLPQAPVKLDWKARKRGYVTRMNTETIGRVLVELGGGRHQATDVVDPAVGLIFHKKLRAKVAVGEPLVTVHASAKTSATRLAELEALFQSAIEIGSTAKPSPKLVLETIT
jgi:thymidine phosphorylase